MAALLLVLALAACGGDAGDTGAAGDGAGQTADSTVTPAEPLPTTRALPRPPGDTVSIKATLTEYAIEVEPDTIAPGSISLLLQNDGERPHTIEVRGEAGGRWVSLPIRPGGGLIMTMNIESGGYTLASTDPSYADRGMRGAFYVH